MKIKDWCKEMIEKAEDRGRKYFGEHYSIGDTEHGGKLHVGNVPRTLLGFPEIFYFVNNATFLRRMQEKAPELELPLRTDLEDFFRGSLKNFIKITVPFKRELNFGLNKVYNGSFESLDFELYYAILRMLKPRMIIEIGAGHSTLVARLAVKRNGKGRIVAIDPEPRIKLPKDIAHIRARVQEINPKIFELLREGDVLFFDSSHTRDEAKYHISYILPRVRRQVVVHYHDILYPFQPRTDEERVILDFIHRERTFFDIIVGAAYVRAHAPLTTLFNLCPSYRYNPNRIPGSLYLRKISDASSA